MKTKPTFILFCLLLLTSIAACSGGSDTNGNISGGEAGTDPDSAISQVPSETISTDLVADWEIQIHNVTIDCDNDDFDIIVDDSALAYIDLVITSDSCAAERSNDDDSSDVWISECAAGAKTVGYEGSITSISQDGGTGTDDCTFTAIWEDSILASLDDSGNLTGTYSGLMTYSKPTTETCGLVNSIDGSVFNAALNCTLTGTVSGTKQTTQTPEEEEPTFIEASITSFTASAESITAGDSVDLSWSIDNGSVNSVLITLAISDSTAGTTSNPTLLTGTETVTPAATTTYTLTLSDDGEVVDSKSVTVTVTPADDGSSTLTGGATLSISLDSTTVNFGSDSLEVDYEIISTYNQDVNFKTVFYFKPVNKANRGALKNEDGTWNLSALLANYSFGEALQCIDDTTSCNIVNDDYGVYSVDVPAGTSATGTMVLNDSVVGDAIAQLFISQPDDSEIRDDRLWFGAQLQYYDGSEWHIVARSNKIKLKDSSE